VLTLEALAQDRTQLDDGTGLVLARVAVDAKTNELTMFTTLLGQVGDLVTAMLAITELLGP
jgi:hypothetical protein